MNAKDFRRIALSFDGAVAGEHMGSADFRVGGHIFATLAHEKEGYGNLMLGPDEQAELVDEMPTIFQPVPGGWGKLGSTHVRLAAADEDILAAALQTAYRLRVTKNNKPKTAKKKTMQ